MSDPHGVERVDEITRLIDEALSGYETQRAGDTWYEDDDIAMAYDDGPFVEQGALTDAERAIRDFWALVQGAVDAVAKIVDDFVAAFGPHLTADSDPMRLSNNWEDRAYHAWNWDTVSDYIDEGELTDLGQ